VPLHEQGGGRLLVGKPTILTPPRDGTQLPVDEVKQAFSDLHRANPIEAVVMDMSRAEDVAQWITDAIGCDVYDRSQGNAHAVSDFDSMTKARAQRRPRAATARPQRDRPQAPGR
jgi:hypothetical protein